MSRARRAGLGEAGDATTVVSTFPPLRDGIARYADQFARQLAIDRSTVRIGLPGSAADHVVNLCGGIRPLRLLTATTRSQDIVVMWHPSFYLTGGALKRAITYVTFAFTLRIRKSVIVVHEHESRGVAEQGWRRLAAMFERAARRAMWRSVDEIRFHNRSQLHRFVEVMDAPDLERRATFIDHSAPFTPAIVLDPRSARRKLALPTEGHLFLCIGFLGRHKGYDRAIESLRQLADTRALLYIVGSTPNPHCDNVAYAADLARAASATAGVTLLDRYVDDVEFDTWLQAADTIVLPYRAASTSGVMARAHLFGVPVIAAAIGGFLEELESRDRLFTDDADLTAAMQARIGERG